MNFGQVTANLTSMKATCDAWRAQRRVVSVPFPSHHIPSYHITSHHCFGHGALTSWEGFWGLGGQSTLGWSFAYLEEGVGVGAVRRRHFSQSWLLSFASKIHLLSSWYTSISRVEGTTGNWLETTTAHHTPSLQSLLVQAWKSMSRIVGRCCWKGRVASR